MHSACHQVEEGTVLKSAHSFHAHPSISSSIPKHEFIYFYLIGIGLTTDSCLCRHATSHHCYIYLIGLGLALSPCDITFFMFLSAALRPPTIRILLLMGYRKAAHPDLTFI
jgi:hypothetical protein